MVTSSASQKRAALLATTSRTDCSSVGEVQFAAKPLDLGFPTGSGGIAMARRL
jgi:hypothetical protein